jgi:hypothetical protein
MRGAVSIPEVGWRIHAANTMQSFRRLSATLTTPCFPKLSRSGRFRLCSTCYPVTSRSVSLHTVHSLIV